jgi:hypothetical protein
MLKHPQISTSKTLILVIRVVREVSHATRAQKPFACTFARAAI